MMGLLCHIGLATWAFESMWLPCYAAMQEEGWNLWIKLSLSYAAYIVAILSAIVACILRYLDCGRFHEKWLPVLTILKGCLGVLNRRCNADRRF
jgi:hypothetical protein